MESTKELVCGFIERLVAGDVESAVSCFAPASCFQEAEGRPLTGHAAIRARLSEFVASGRRWRMEIDEVFEGKTVERAAVTYRFIIESQDGKHSERAGCAVIERSGSRIVQWREYKA
jgi:limonene-1,2-epoxide hydrolase